MSDSVPLIQALLDGFAYERRSGRKYADPGKGTALGRLIESGNEWVEQHHRRQKAWVYRCGVERLTEAFSKFRQGKITYRRLCEEARNIVWDWENHSASGMDLNQLARTYWINEANEGEGSMDTAWNGAVEVRSQVRNGARVFAEKMATSFLGEHGHSKSMRLGEEVAVRSGWLPESTSTRDRFEAALREVFEFDSEITQSILTAADDAIGKKKYGELRLEAWKMRLPKMQADKRKKKSSPAG